MSRQPRRFSMHLGINLFCITAFLSALGGSPSVAHASETTPSEERAAAAPMHVYALKGPTDDAGLVLLGPAESLGGRTIEGNMQIYARMDYNEKGRSAGIFKATTGKVSITFPFNEHATILEGQVSITDETGQTHVFKKGESYFIHQGQTVIVEVKDGYVLKTFFNIM